MARPSLGLGLTVIAVALVVAGAVGVWSQRSAAPLPVGPLGFRSVLPPDPRLDSAWMRRRRQPDASLATVLTVRLDGATRRPVEVLVRVQGGLLHLVDGRWQSASQGRDTVVRVTTPALITLDARATAVDVRTRTSSDAVRVELVVTRGLDRTPVYQGWGRALSLRRRGDRWRAQTAVHPLEPTVVLRGGR